MLAADGFKQEERSSLGVLRSSRQSWQHRQCPVTFRLLELSLVRSVRREPERRVLPEDTQGKNLKGK